MTVISETDRDIQAYREADGLTGMPVGDLELLDPNRIIFPVAVHPDEVQGLIAKVIIVDEKSPIG